ncbi:MAG: type IV pilus twitching motility protein PilT [Anaerovoracaceae bacterium]
MSYNVVEVLKKAEELKASDIHITVGRPPMLRVKGKLIPFGEDPLIPEDTKDICFGLLSEEKKAILLQAGQVDLSWSLPGLNRYRVNVFRQRSSYAAALRRINSQIPTFEEMNIPWILKDMSLKPRGLVLITGPTGSGKSTTLAAMVGHINENRNCHVITIEEPIEYLHKHNKSIVNQREVGTDTGSFADALRGALREDPDVILVGEMRDLETIGTAISAAETGHFVMSTVHTVTAAQTIDRIIDAFPPYQQQQVKTQLANILQGIVCQQLLLTEDGERMIPAMEILIMNDAARNLIREGKQHQIDTILQTNIKNGMMPMDYALADLVRNGEISKSLAISRCVDREVFERYLTSI